MPNLAKQPGYFLFVQISRQSWTIWRSKLLRGGPVAEGKTEKCHKDLLYV
jgi:hypothetical protein